MSDRKRFHAFAVRSRGTGGTGTIWTRAGVAVLDPFDGSVNVTLDVLPLDGRLHLRPADARNAAAEIYARVANPTATALPVSYEIMLRNQNGQRVVGTVATDHLGPVFEAVANAALAHRANVAPEWLQNGRTGVRLSPPPKEKSP